MTQAILYLLAAVGACNVVFVVFLLGWMFLHWWIDRPQSVPRSSLRAFTGVETPRRPLPRHG